MLTSFWTLYLSSRNSRDSFPSRRRRRSIPAPGSRPRPCLSIPCAALPMPPIPVPHVSLPIFNPAAFQSDNRRWKPPVSSFHGNRRCRSWSSLIVEVVLLPHLLIKRSRVSRRGRGRAPLRRLHYAVAVAVAVCSTTAAAGDDRRRTSSPLPTPSAAQWFSVWSFMLGVWKD